MMEWAWEGGVGRGLVIMVGRLEETSRCWKKLIGHTAAAKQEIRWCHLGRGLKKVAGPVCGGVGRHENAC